MSWVIFTSTPPTTVSVSVPRCSYIGKTDQNPPLAVGQSCQRPQGIPQQGNQGAGSSQVKLKKHLILLTAASGALPSQSIVYFFNLSSKFSPFSPFLSLTCHFTLYLSSTSSSHSYLSPLLSQDPKERLGCHPQTGFADIMGHPFFRNVDWDLVRF